MYSNVVLEVTQESVAAAREFILKKWHERADDLGQPIPMDLSGSCKFTSRFVREVFGGEIRGNFFHQWVDVNGSVLDLNEHARDVKDLATGRVPEKMMAYAKLFSRAVPDDLYTHDEVHMRSRAQRESMASVSPRVMRWVEQFRALMAARVNSERSPDFTPSAPSH